MNNQDLADTLQKLIAETRALLVEAERRACNQAGDGCEKSEAALPHVTLALAAATTAHAETTKAASYMPDVTARMGGK